MLNQTSILKALSSIRQGVTKHGSAPHKLVLILTIIELIEKGHFFKNRFSIDSVFVAHFRENWRLLVNTPHISDFTQPFYYLQNDKIDGNPIWILHPNIDYAITAPIKSINLLTQAINYASFDENFYLSLQNLNLRSLAIATILDKYFPQTKDTFVLAKENRLGYIHDLTSYMLNEKEASYITNSIVLDEEEIFVRSGYFPKIIRQVYSSTCCMSGMRIYTDFGQDLIEAAHIVPFSVSHDDKVTNGLALCPNLHTAFDRGLLTINDEYKILVSPIIIEDIDNPYSLSRLKDKKIKLPFADRAYPDIDNLRWHRNNVFKQ